MQHTTVASTYKWYTEATNAALIDHGYSTNKINKSTTRVKLSIGTCYKTNNSNGFKNQSNHPQLFPILLLNQKEICKYKW